MELQGKAVLIKPDENPEKMGSIHIPETAKDKPNSGIVIDVGPGCKEISKGDRVKYPRKAGNVIIIEGVEHHFIIEDQIEYIDGREISE